MISGGLSRMPKIVDAICANIFVFMWMQLAKGIWALPPDRDLYHPATFPLEEVRRQAGQLVVVQYLTLRRRGKGKSLSQVCIGGCRSSPLFVGVQDMPRPVQLCRLPAGSIGGDRQTLWQ